MCIADSEKYAEEQRLKKIEIQRQKDELRNFYAEQAEAAKQNRMLMAEQNKKFYRMKNEHAARELKALEQKEQWQKQQKKKQLYEDTKIGVGQTE